MSLKLHDVDSSFIMLLLFFFLANVILLLQDKSMGRVFNLIGIPDRYRIFKCYEESRRCE